MGKIDWWDVCRRLTDLTWDEFEELWEEFLEHNRVKALN